MLEEIAEALKTVGGTRIPGRTEIGRLLKLGLTRAPEVDVEISKEDLDNIYEIRARLLDWVLGTGYLGYFSSNPGIRYVYVRRLETIMSMLPQVEGKRVLDAGCVCGVVALELAKRAKHVVGVDMSPSAIDFGKKLAQFLGYENVQLEVGDVENLELGEGSVDLVVCTEVLEHLLRPERALREFYRVLNKNGKSVVSTPCEVSPRKVLTSASEQRSYVFDRMLYSALKGKSSTFPLERAFRVHRRFDYSSLIQLFHKSGFTVVEVKGSVVALPHHALYAVVPKPVLDLFRRLEDRLNESKIFPRYGSLTTVFSCQKYPC